MIQVASKFITKETAQAIKNIQEIIRRFPDYGIVDVFQLYPAKDVIMSTVALSRLQNIVINSDKWQTNAVGDQEICSLASNKDLIHDLAYYSVYANAAYALEMFDKLLQKSHNFVTRRILGINQRLYNLL